VVSWPSMGVACCRKAQCNIAYGWVERNFPSVSWLVEGFTEQISVLPGMSHACLLMVANCVMFM
jgi:hypothetical protein